MADKGSTIRLVEIDALRGVAALAVVLLPGSLLQAGEDPIDGRVRRPREVLADLVVQLQDAEWPRIGPQQIDHELPLSTSTVRTHLHNIYGKLGAVDRAQAVLIATERGWL